MKTKETFASLGIVGALLMAQSTFAEGPVPEQGQTKEQMESDRAVCEREASAATGFNPYASSAPAEKSDSALRKAAKGAAAGALVGAIAGDAGKGAAAGAAAGGASAIVGKREGLLGGGLGGAAVGAAAGAAAGDAGKGAAIGAAVGGLKGAARKREASAKQQQEANYNAVFEKCMHQRGYSFPAW